MALISTTCNHSASCSLIFARNSEGHSYTSQGPVARLVDRKSVIQSSFATPSLDSTKQTQRQAIGRDLMARIFRGLDRGRVSQLWLDAVEKVAFFDLDAAPCY
jgi:hypothetical protein